MLDNQQWPEDRVKRLPALAKAFHLTTRQHEFGLSRNSYVFRQLAGWGVWAVVNAAVSLSSMPYSTRAAGKVCVAYVLSMIYGIALSHCLFLALRSREDFSIKRQLPIAIPGIFLCGAAMAAADIFINSRWLNLIWFGRNLASFWAVAANRGFLFLIWISLHFLIYQSRQRLEAETTRGALELAMSEAQYKSLSAQVQPHFFFNALNTIRALIYENPQQADQTVTRLATILRSGLQSDNSKEQPLSAELEIVTDYLSIQKLRFEGRLDWAFDIEENVLRAMVPPMSIQHLVENALKHGIEHLPAGGTVEVSAKGKDSFLQVMVRNSAPSLTVETEDSTRSGLQNTRQRLQLLYGMSASLTLERHADSVTATMLIPMEGTLKCE